MRLSSPREGRAGGRGEGEAGTSVPRGKEPPGRSGCQSLCRGHSASSQAPAGRQATKSSRFHYSYKADIQRVPPLYFFILPCLNRAFPELVLRPPGPGETAVLGPSSSGRQTSCQFHHARAPQSSDFMPHSGSILKHFHLNANSEILDMHKSPDSDSCKPPESFTGKTLQFTAT